MRDKWIIKAIISFALLGGLGYFSYLSHQNARTQYLREAIAYEDMSKYEEAARSYEQHLLKYPEDVFSKFRLAMVWRKFSEEDKCVKLLHKIAHEISELKYKERNLFRSNEGWEKLSGKLVETATIKIPGDSEVLSYRENIKLILAREYLDIYDNFVSGKYNNESKVIEALSGLANAKGRYSFILWLEGNKVEALGNISSGPDDRFLSSIINKHKLKPANPISTYKGFLTRFFSNELKSWTTSYSKSEWKEEKICSLVYLLLNAGKDNFDKGEYHKALKVFADGVTYSTYGGLKKNNPLISELLYNLAITYWYEGDFFSAETTLLTLQKESPEYEKGKVTAQIIDAKEKVAIDMFDKDKYKKARQAYEGAIAYCISVGYKEDNPIVAEFMFKIAKTYGMEGDYSSEKDALLRLKKLSPKYKSKLIIVRPVIR